MKLTINRVLTNKNQTAQVRLDGATEILHHLTFYKTAQAVNRPVFESEGEDGLYIHPKVSKELFDAAVVGKTYEFSIEL